MRRFAPLCVLAVVAVAGASTNINGNIAGTSPGIGTAFGGNATTIYKASGFVMPPGLGYTLDEAILSMDFTSPDAMPMVSIWDGALPENQLVTLSTSMTLGGQADYVFTPDAPLTLQPNTTYWLWVEAPAGSPDFSWAGTDPSTTPTGVATHIGFLFNDNPSSFFNRHQINGTIVPEPTSLALLGVVAVVAIRRR